MIFFLTVISLFVFSTALAPDFYLDVMLYGSQLLALPKSYLFSIIIPCAFASTAVCFKNSFKFHYRYIFFFFFFLVLSNLAGFVSVDADPYILATSIIKSFICFVCFFFLIGILQYYLTAKSLFSFFTPFLFLLCISSLFAAFSLIIYQSGSFLPSFSLVRFSSTLSSESFLNPYVIQPFGLVESIPYKSIFARSTWFVLEPIHFSFYIFSFFLLSVLSLSPVSVLLSFSFLFIGLLASKSLTSLISIVFIAFFYLILTHFSRRNAILLCTLFSYIPFFLYEIFKTLIELFFNFFGKSTNYQTKVLEFSNFPAFFHDFLIGSSSPQSISHNLSLNMFVHFGFPLSFAFAFLVIFIIVSIYNSFLHSRFAYLSLAVLITMLFIQLPTSYHILYAFIFAVLSVFSSKFHYEHN